MWGFTQVRCTRLQLMVYKVLWDQVQPMHHPHTHMHYTSHTHTHITWCTRSFWIRPNPCITHTRAHTHTLHITHTRARAHTHTHTIHHTHRLYITHAHTDSLYIICARTHTHAHARTHAPTRTHTGVVTQDRGLRVGPPGPAGGPSRAVCAAATHPRARARARTRRPGSVSAGRRWD